MYEALYTNVCNLQKLSYFKSLKIPPAHQGLILQRHLFHSWASLASLSWLLPPTLPPLLLLPLKNLRIVLWVHLGVPGELAATLACGFLLGGVENRVLLVAPDTPCLLFSSFELGGDLLLTRLGTLCTSSFPSPSIFFWDMVLGEILYVFLLVPAHPAMLFVTLSLFYRVKLFGGTFPPNTT